MEVCVGAAIGSRQIDYTLLRELHFPGQGGVGHHLIWISRLLVLLLCSFFLFSLFLDITLELSVELLRTAPNPHWMPLAWLWCGPVTIVVWTHQFWCGKLGSFQFIYASHELDACIGVECVVWPSRMATLHDRHC